MFKTNSRKGLSLAAIVALAASLFAAVPAQASDVSLTPTAGTTNSTISGETFSFSAVAGAGTTGADWSTLKFRIANSANVTFSATVSAAAGGTDASTNSQTVSAAVLGAGSTESRVATVGITTNFTASNAVLTVQSWLDLDGSGTINGNEPFSPVQTLNFWDLANVTFTTTLTPVTLGAGKVVASVTTNRSINFAQAGALYIGLATVSGATYSMSVSGTSVSAAGAFTTGPAVTLDTPKTTGKVEVTHTVLAASTYVAQALYGATPEEVGSEVYSTVGAASVTAMQGLTLSPSANTNTSDQIRTTATSVEVVAQVSKSAGVAAATGTAVKVTLTEGAVSGLKAGGSVTAGGVSLTNSVSTTVQSVEFTTTVGAAGKVSFPVALAGLANGNSFKVKLSAQGVETEATYTITDTAPGSVVNLTYLGTGAVLKAARGATVTMTFGAMDNFGQPLSGDYRFLVTNTGKTATISAAVVNGVASVSYTDLTDKTEGAFTATLQEMSKATNTYVDVDPAKTASLTPEFGTVTAPAAVTLTPSTTSSAAINNQVLAAADTRVGATAPKVTTGTVIELSGSLTDANGLATTGEVTLSAPDSMFEVGGLYTLGSATVRTDSSGNYAGVKIYRNIAGAVTVSATAGSATKDLGITFAAAAETAGAEWILTVPSNVIPGSTAQIKAKLVDKWGNPVQVTSASRLAVSWTGPGFVTSTLPAATDKNGEMSFAVLLGTADTGTATVTFAYDGDATATTTTDNVAKTATITIGAAAATPASDQRITVGSFKGFVAIYTLNYTGQKLSAKVAGRWLVQENLSRFQRVVRLTGAAIPIKVDLYIDGKFVRTENIVTK